MWQSSLSAVVRVSLLCLLWVFFCAILFAAAGKLILLPKQKFHGLRISEVTQSARLNCFLCLMKSALGQMCVGVCVCVRLHVCVHAGVSVCLHIKKNAFISWKLVKHMFLFLQINKLDGSGIFTASGLKSSTAFL